MITSEKVRKVAESYEQFNAEERHEFLKMLAPMGESEVNQEWVGELRNRADDIDSGRVKLVDGEEFMRRFRAI